uniref:Uncharacterized protein n=1 Tax=Anopheles dirus TaxID=7168 RepID=A0A182N6P7_9DIPT
MSLVPNHSSPPVAKRRTSPEIRKRATAMRARSTCAYVRDRQLISIVKTSVCATVCVSFRARCGWKQPRANHSGGAIATLSTPPGPCNNGDRPKAKETVQHEDDGAGGADVVAVRAPTQQHVSTVRAASAVRNGTDDQ